MSCTRTHGAFECVQTSITAGRLWNALPLNPTQHDSISKNRYLNWDFKDTILQMIFLCPFLLLPPSPPLTSDMFKSYQDQVQQSSLLRCFWISCLLCRSSKAESRAVSLSHQPSISIFTPLSPVLQSHKYGHIKVKIFSISSCIGDGNVTRSVWALKKLKMSCVCVRVCVVFLLSFCAVLIAFRPL